ncbi:argininosuccinate lyase [Streptosporangium carneum]|uniref:argininosuccinate lyase n=1 Tax=Streptosporangium carneum TaxID=47481 RepID=A0A9W6I7G8_9ACTN|nr:lyase family protein [Streptosporangium carneum]GLK12334.1 argininosuccinate lyase [Streptosporangium carneum]
MTPRDERPLTGRIGSGPHDLLRTEILEPQMRLELDRLLPWYVRLEKVLLLEYLRMGLMDEAEALAIARALDQAGPEALEAHARSAMSDLAFTLESFVTGRLERVPQAWHVDRSRNDLQAAAQALFCGARLLDVVDGLLAFGRAAHRLATATADMVMPGYTHLQAAQVITPGFYLAALCDQTAHALRRLEPVYLTAAATPMGAGAMSGQELPWDRERMARLLGCQGVRLHALRAVAGRDWALEATAELSLLGVVLSRFTTDLMAWGGAGHRFVDLPDEWSGISSAMPQKKNFPVLERIRGKTAHLLSGYVDVAAGQRNTSYSNSVEVSKEAGARVPETFDTAESVLRLFTAVLDRLEFRADRMRAACEEDHLGGFTLANLLTLHRRVPWRTAQVIAGRYIVAAERKGLTALTPDPALLAEAAAEQGHSLADPGELLREAFDVDRALTAKRTPGSAHPERVRELLGELEAEFDRSEKRWRGHRERLDGGLAEIDRAFARLTPGRQAG